MNSPTPPGPAPLYGQKRGLGFRVEVCGHTRGRQAREKKEKEGRRERGGSEKELTAHETERAYDCQKRPMLVSKVAYTSVKRGLYTSAICSHTTVDTVINACASVSVYRYTCVCARARANTHTHTHKHTQTHTHVYIYGASPEWNLSAAA